MIWIFSCSTQIIPSQEYIPGKFTGSSFRTHHRGLRMNRVVLDLVFPILEVSKDKDFKTGKICLIKTQKWEKRDFWTDLLPTEGLTPRPLVRIFRRVTCPSTQSYGRPQKKMQILQMTIALLFLKEKTILRG